MHDVPGLNGDRETRTEWGQRLVSVVLAIGGILLIAGAIAVAWAGSHATKTAAGLTMTVGLSLCGLSRIQWFWLKSRIAVAMCSFTLVFIVADICLRAVTSFPINETSNIIPHPSLGHVLDPTRPDVDMNGFRNPELPTSAQLVTIGDSHTQGFGVTSEESWPRVLGGLLNKTVYNFGIGGYGPLQYESLVDEALKLKPETIVVGLYIGNDFADAAEPKETKQIAVADINPFRHALKHHTAIGSLYQHVSHRMQLNDSNGTTINHNLNPTVIAHHRLEYLAAATDMDIPEIKRGFVSTVHILNEAHRRCAAQNCQLVVLIIPTREFVYSKIAGSSELPQSYRTLVRNETNIHEQLSKALRDHSISHSNALPCLRSALEIVPDVYATYNDGHPRKSGYVAYAAAAFRMLQTSMAAR